MAQVKIKIPGFKELDGEEPIVILGPNGSGKTRLAQQLARENQVSAISAQRRTWVDDNLPVQEKQQLHKTYDLSWISGDSSRGTPPRRSTSSCPT